MSAKKKTVTKPILNLEIFTSHVSGHFGDVDSNSTWCNGECGDYCRCSKITNAHVNYIYLTSIMQTIVPKKYRNSILEYCVERVLRLCGVFDDNNWEVNIIDGYYGEEVGGITLNYNIQKTALEHLTAIIKKNDDLLMEYILKLEYGYLLPILRAQTWKIHRINRQEIEVGQSQYYERKLDLKIVKSYTDDEYEFPIAVCIRNADNSYRLIDGYHRFAATEKVQKITIILAE